MKKPYYKELPLFHIYDSNLTGSQKLLMTLLLIDDTYDIYTLGCLARRRDLRSAGAEKARVFSR